MPHVAPEQAKDLVGVGLVATLWANDIGATGGTVS